MYISVSMYACSMYVCVYLYMYVYRCTRMCRCARVGIKCTFIFICMFGCVLQYFGSVWWDPDQLQKTQTRFRFMLVMDPIHRQSEDRPMGWSVDPYRFVQWRPDGDLVPKSRHFMWVFVLVHFLIYRCRYAFTYYCYHFMRLSVIFYQFDNLYHFVRHLWLFTLVA